MTTISAKIIADSISANGKRLTTLQLRYPRFIHAEFMTHRVFSRNASSSRAIPVERLIKDVQGDPAVPLYWGKNQKGMQAGEECNTEIQAEEISPFDTLENQFLPVSREEAWRKACTNALVAARAFSEAGYHKQTVNRLLEPFSHINVIVTATSWSNFFALRDHPDAEPHIQHLAREMRAAMDASQPVRLETGEWHAPYAPGDLPLNERLMVSVARCARVSYLTHDGKTPTLKADLQLFQQLRDSGHWSPFEHQGTPCQGQSGNFDGWLQYRKQFPNENR